MVHVHSGRKPLTMYGTEDKLTEHNRIREQILTIRDTSEVNMSDVPNVERLAYYYNCHNLIEHIREDRAEYLSLIMAGKFD